MRGREDGDELASVERFAARRGLVVVLVTLAFAGLAVYWILQLRAAGIRGAGARGAASGAAGGLLGDRVGAVGLLWVLWGLVVLKATFGPGGVQWSARQRRVLNDELAAAHRRAAAGVGYGLLLAGLLALCGAAVTGAAAPGTLLHVAVPALVTLGVAGPALVFSALQRRAGTGHDPDGGGDAIDAERG